MPISIATMLRQGVGSWRLGKTERFPATDSVVSFENMTLVRRDQSQQVINASEYPEFYNAVRQFYPNDFLSVRNPAGQTQVRAIASNGTTVMAVGNGGIISRSTDGGDTWSQMTSPVNVNLYVVAYDPTNTRWVIPYATNKLLISTNNGTTWVDTTVSGLSHNFTQASAEVYNMRLHIAAGIMVLASQGKVFSSADGGSSWTDVSVSAVGGKLTYGNGFFVIVTPAGSVRYSSNGTTWTVGATLNTSMWDKNYGLVWEGLYWVWGCQTLVVGGVSTGVPANQPPPTTGYPTGQSLVLQYSTGLNSFLSKSVNVGSSEVYEEDDEWYWAEDTAGCIVGPFGQQGFYCGTTTTAPVESFILYGNTPYRTLIANFNTTEPPIAGTDIAADTDSYQEIGITQGNIIWTLESAGLSDVKLTINSVNPSLALPVFTQTGSGEGNWYTRIK
jgi:hypothetical protein